MAFSTQKEFFHIPYINESYEFNCNGVCVNLKTYSSSVDDRSWSENEDKKSRFVSDLVACNHPVFVKQVNKTESKSVKSESQNKYTKASLIDTNGSNLLLEDSLINAADDAIDWLQDLMIRNNILKNQLHDVKPFTTKMESTGIKNIIKQRDNRDNARILQAKIFDWATSKKELHEERELKEILSTIDDINKAQDLLEAENTYLKRIIEKQSTRCRFDSLKIDPELSTNVDYLQRKINEMGKELLLLRQTEDMLIRKCAKMCRSECSEAFSSEGLSMKNAFSLEHDISNVQRILEERDSLRKKCKNLEALGEKLNSLEQKANEAEHISGNIEDNLSQQNQNINEVQQEMDKMKIYYENEVDRAKGLKELLACRCNQVTQELLSAKCAAQYKQMELEELRRQLLKRDIALHEYDCQYQQLMIVVCELNQRYCNQHGPCPGVFPAYSPELEDDLAFYTRVTLDHIMNELCKQSDCFRIINQNRRSEEPAINSLEECTIELERLRELLSQQTGVRHEKNEITYSTEKCNQEIKRLNDLLKKKDEQLGELIEENDCLCEAAEVNKRKLDDLDYQVQKLDEDTRHMEQGIVESIGLIQDIGAVSQENDLLKGQISQLQDSESRQLFDDLSKQLEDCREESHVMREINEALGKTLQEAGIDPIEIENKIKLNQSSKRELPNKDLPGIERPLNLAGPSGSIKESDKYLDKTVMPGFGSLGVDEMQNNKVKGPETVSSEKYTYGTGKEIGYDSDRGAKSSHLLRSPSGIGESGTIHAVAIEGEKIQAAEPELTQTPNKEQGRGADVELEKGVGADNGSPNKPNDSIAKKKNGEIAGRGSLENEKENGAKQQNPSAEQGGVPKNQSAEQGGVPKNQSAEQGGVPKNQSAKKQLGSGAAPDSRPGLGTVGEASKVNVTATGEKNKLASGSGKTGSKLAPAAPGIESESGQSVKQEAESNRVQTARKLEETGLGEGREDITITNQGVEKNASNEAKPLKVPKSGGGLAQAAGGSVAQGVGLTVGQEMTDNPKQGDRTKLGPKTREVQGTVKSTGQGAILGPGVVKEGVAKSRAEVTSPGDHTGGSRAIQPKAVRGVGLSGQQERSSAKEDTARGSKIGNKNYKKKGDKNLTSDSASSARISHGSSVLIKIGIKNKMGKRSLSRCRNGGQFDDFVRQTVQSLSAGDIDGCALEKELRKILDMFIDECGFCFCKCNVPKSRFYAICHKLYHHGLHTLDFRELAYMHKRIYAAAENILPGCLFNMIVKEITTFSFASTIHGQYTETPFNTQHLQKCCNCKTTLCCDTNEEKLLHKVIRLESDIKNAKTCLKNLKSIPSHLSIPRCRFSLESLSDK